MRTKTSVTLSEDVLTALDHLGGKGANRSALIEEAVRFFLTSRERQARDARDLELINRNADALNDELGDALEYQDAP